MTDPNPFAFVRCRTHGDVPLTAGQYDDQIVQADSDWKCPTCGGPAVFDDEAYELIHYPEAEEERHDVDPRELLEEQAEDEAARLEWEAEEST